MQPETPAFMWVFRRFLYQENYATVAWFYGCLSGVFKNIKAKHFLTKRKKIDPSDPVYGQQVILRVASSIRAMSPD